MFNILEQEHTLNTHIDTLTEWWDGAERGIAHDGDLIISYSDAAASISRCKGDMERENEGIRILHRAPAPKPAWHDAVAVTIGRIGRRDVFVKDPDSDAWTNAGGNTTLGTSIIAMYAPHPLIEQKVTDEMVSRYLVATYPTRRGNADLSTYDMRTIESARGKLASILGVDPA